MPSNDRNIKTQYLPRPIVLLDICIISHIKSIGNLESKGEAIIKRLDELSEMVKSGKYRFSLLMAIIEKGTDYKNVLDTQKMIDIFKSDYSQIVDFLGSNNLVEPPEALEQLIPIFMDVDTPLELRAELSLPASLKLLDFFNRELRVYQTPNKNERLKYAERIAEEAENLGLKKGHPTIAICIASIYGCQEAQNILKVKHDVSDFNASNAQGDIQSFYRLAKTRSHIARFIPGDNIIFFTADAALDNMHTWFKTTVTGESEEGTLMKTTIVPEKLLPTLYKKGECIDQKQLARIYELMDYKI
ncbi:hypothetical protein MFFDBJGM_00674 [Pectobacterium versatile]|uniref:hypothetical protein n=1 Tax=Pectobacterium versatile TaxID=2488639 RepID=UPI000DAB34F4|nr:hypothetical protein [Pectobacterium versatile]MBQ4761428.1 hypothetical protein [Pectobacterium versatile]GBO47671.1 hypothetical protein MFFDBJGM_00674 [Pectobacterium versatile]